MLKRAKDQVAHLFTGAMDALLNILNLPDCSNSQASDGSPTKDVYEQFVESSKNKPFQLNPHLLKELQTLEDKHTLIDNSIEALIPAISEYFKALNEKLAMLTKDLSFIKGKSFELASMTKNNSSKLADISPIVNDLIISPELVEQVVRGKIDSKWTECIDYLNDKEEIYNKYLESVDKPKDFSELRDILNILKSVATERAKKYIVIRIKRLRDGHPVPSQRIQEELLSVREIYQFIANSNKNLAAGLRTAYVSTMKWYYKTYFARYIRSLTILQYVPIDSQYALGQGLSNTSFSNSYANYIFSGSKTLFGQAQKSFQITDESVNDYFQISKRLSVLTQEDKTVMVSQIAENNPATSYIEVGFKNLNLAILDNCTAEFVFLNDFFRIPEDDGDLIRSYLKDIFEPTFEKALEFTENLIESSFDIFGILISIRIAHKLQFEAQTRQIPCIDDYINDQLMLLWPKFQQLVDFQCTNLRNTAVTTNAATAGGTMGPTDPLLAPHELTVQFSKFLVSLLTLSVTHREMLDERSEPLFNSINRLRDDFETFMTKCSKKTKNAEKFLTANYVYLLNILQQTAISSDTKSEPLIVSETRTHFSQLLDAYNK